MDKELKESIIRLLEQCKEPYGFTFGSNAGDIKVADLLAETGYLSERQAKVFTTTLHGLEYLDHLKENPVKVWLRSNWFAAIVAAATIIFAGVSAGVQLTDLLTS